MDIKTVTTTQATLPQSRQPRQEQHPAFLRLTRLAIEVGIITVLALVAFLPRLLLAMKLDMVTDEVVYILGGKIYLPLLTHLRIDSNQWSYNYEHPPFVKLLIGLALTINTALGHPLSELLTARLPSILMGTLLIVAIYWMGREPFGRVIALTAALCLAVSPWLVYFSALAYLDMTMTALITLAYLLTWHAIRRPWLYLIVALLVGLGADSKYTAVLVIPGIVIFTGYYFFLIRLRISATQRPRIPWLWWLGAIILAPIAFLAADPAIWPHPLSLLIHSFRFEWNHSYNGHLTFLAGRDELHVPRWTILYIIFAKISAFVTLPAAFFAVFGFIQLLRFHLSKTTATEAASTSFLLIWLVSVLSMFSLLNIVVGTHYYLPLAAPVALAGATGLASILRYRRGSLSTLLSPKTGITREPDVVLPSPTSSRSRVLHAYPAIAIALFTAALVGPHLIGLTTVYAAEGYTSEFFPNENSVLQVAYPGYREAVQWIATQTHGTQQVGLAAVPGTLSNGRDGVSWYSYNSDLPSRLKLSETHAGATYQQYDYVVWPMHLVQRGFALPKSWRIVHTVFGGSTIYCYILARPATT
ncbi:MAG: hypothetical protein NVS4B12_06830 [Ktedonobacteraceae bacterium]